MGVMYHVSDIANRESIRNDGLRVSADQTGVGGVFLADVVPAPQTHLDVWRVDATALDLEEDWTGEPDEGRWWVCFTDVSPNRLTLMPPEPEIDQDTPGMGL